MHSCATKQVDLAVIFQIKTGLHRNDPCYASSKVGWANDGAVVLNETILAAVSLCRDVRYDRSIRPKVGV